MVSRVRSDESTQAGQRFAERAHDQLHLVGQAEMVGRARSVLAQHADGMGVIHHDRRPVPLGQTTNLGQVNNVALHAEDAIDDDELARLRINRFQAVLQGCHVIVGQPQELSRREEDILRSSWHGCFCPPG